MNIIDISLIIVFFVNVILSTLIFLHRRESSGSKFFAVAAYSTTLWVVAMFFFRNISNLNILIISTKLLYIAGILITVNFLYFSYTFLENSLKERKNLFLLIGIFPLILVGLIIFSRSIIKDIIFFNNERVVEFGPLYLASYSVLMLIYFIWAYSNLFKKLKKSTPGSTERMQLLYVTIGTFVSVVFGLVYDIVIPYFGNFDFYWLGPIMTISFVAATSYSVLKHRLFNIRVIATELLIFALWVIFLIRFLMADNLQQRFIEGGFLAAITIFGFWIIKSVLDEVKRREEVEKISKELELANERLKELDRIKTEFLSFATHQIKAPLTAVKGFASLIGDNSYGVVPEKVKEISQRIIKAANRLVDLVDNILNLGRIESGKMEYNFEEIDFVKLVMDVIDDFKQVAIEKKLDLLFEFEKIPQGEPLKIKADVQKLRQVVQNLIDNAIKYTEEGFVRVALKNEGQSVLLSVIDTGMGILPELLPHLFQKFVRETAPGQTIQGTGLGLYIAKEIIKAHNGEIWAESEGRGFGSQFYVRINKVA